MRRIAARCFVAAVAGAFLAGCDAPYDPHAGEEEVQIHIAGTVTWADGSPMAGATVFAETFSCYDAYGNFDCTWSTGGRWVMLASVRTGPTGAYSISWMETCRPGSPVSHPQVVVPGVPRERMWLFDVSTNPEGFEVCSAESQHRDYVVARRTPLAGTCPGGYTMVDASYAEWADGNEDQVVCRSASNSYRDNDALP